MHPELKIKRNYVISELHKLRYFDTNGLTYMKLKIRLALEREKRDMK